jgi:hypothetical protein
MNNANTLYGVALMTHRSLRIAVAALFTLGILLPVGMVMLLGASWIDVGLGILVSMGLSVVLGFLTGIAVALLGAEKFYFEHLDKIALALGVIPTIIGIGIFAGLSAALLIVCAPMLITMPASYALRAYALRHYA